MTDLRPTLTFLAWAVTLLLAGCSRQSSPPAAGEDPARAAGQAAKSPAPAEDPDDPAHAARQLASGLADNRLPTVLAAFPDSYRSDLDSLLSARFGSMDPAARRAAAAAIGDLADVLASKQEFLLRSRRFAIEGRAAEYVRERLAPLLRVIAATARWEGWASPDEQALESLLARLVGAIAAEPALASDLRQLQFETRERQGDRAILLVRSESHPEPVELSLVQIEGCWIPETLASRWEALVADAADPQPSDVSRRDARMREVTLRIQEITDGLSAVSTQEEFDALAQRGADALLAAATQPAPRPVGRDEFVTVTILGRLTDDEKNRLVWELASRTDEPSNGLADATDLPGGEGFVITVGPVKDPQAFARRQPGLTVEHVDVETKAITARLDEP